MNIGGVTPLTLPSSLPLWVDSKVMQRTSIVLGGGNRSSKIKVSPKIFNYTTNTEIVEGLATLKTKYPSWLMAESYILKKS